MDTIEILQGQSLTEALQRIKERAIEEAVKTGAVRGSVGIVDVNVLPVQVGISRAFLSSVSSAERLCLVCHKPGDAYHRQSRWRTGTRRESGFVGW